MKAVIVRKNVQGNGFDTQNSAMFCTRHKFTPWSSTVDDEETPSDIYIARVCGVTGLCNVGAYAHDGTYDLHVRKATAFDWSEIEPAIMAILEARHEDLSAPPAEAAETTVQSEDTTDPPTLRGL